MYYVRYADDFLLMFQYENEAHEVMAMLSARLGVRTSKKKLKTKKQTVKAWMHDNMHKPISETMKRIQLSLQGHFNYYGVSGNLAQIEKFWNYVRYEYYRVLNKRHQKRSMKYLNYLRIWNHYVGEPHLTKDIWNWKPKLI